MDEMVDEMVTLRKCKMTADECSAAIKKSTPPAQLMSEMNRANTIIRDSLNGSFSQIAADDEAM